MKIDYKNILKTAGNWILRNLVWIVIIGLGLYYLNPTFEFMHKLVTIAVLEGMALGFSGIALYAYTKVNFTKKLMYGSDNELSKFEQVGASIVIGCIFVGVHILIGISFYILQLEVL